MGHIKCVDCNSTGIAIVAIGFTQDYAIERCDTCMALNSDREAMERVKAMLYGTKAKAL